MFPRRFSSRTQPRYVTDEIRVAPASRPSSCIVGVDLGQRRDMSAVVVIEVYEDQRARYVSTGFSPVEAIPLAPQRRYHVVNVHRYVVGTNYMTVAASLAGVVEQLREGGMTPELVIDASGVGRPVVDILRNYQLKPVSVTIGGGFEATPKGTRSFSVPKAVLVSTLDAVLTSERIHITTEAAASDDLARELRAFSVIDGRRMEGLRSHDDIVMALAVGLWRGENVPAPTRFTNIDFLSR